MKQINKINLIVMRSTIMVAFFMLPVAVFAATTVIENNVSSSVSTGGNTSKGSSAGEAADGEITEGESSASVHVETNVNGETVEKIDKHVKDPDGPVEIHSKFQSDDGTVETNTTVTANGSQKARTQEEEPDEIGEKEQSTSSATVGTLADVRTSSDTATDTEKEKKESRGMTGAVVAFMSKIASYVSNIF